MLFSVSGQTWIFVKQKSGEWVKSCKKHAEREGLLGRRLQHMQVCQSALSASLSEVIQRGSTKPCSIWPKNHSGIPPSGLPGHHNDAWNIKDSDKIASWHFRALFAMVTPLERYCCPSLKTLKSVHHLHLWAQRESGLRWLFSLH